MQGVCQRAEEGFFAIATKRSVSVETSTRDRALVGGGSMASPPPHMAKRTKQIVKFMSDPDPEGPTLGFAL